jgi:hypothetical protein
LLHAVQGISDLITIGGLVNVDFADVKTIMSNMGMALMGTGYSSGPARAREAAEMAISSPLLEDVSINGATGILLNVTGGPDLSLFEINEASTLIQEAAHESANIIFGAVIDNSMRDEIKITVIATGFDRMRDEYAYYNQQAAHRGHFDSQPSHHSQPAQSAYRVQEPAAQQQSYAQEQPQLAQSHHPSGPYNAPLPPQQRSDRYSAHNPYSGYSNYPPTPPAAREVPPQQMQAERSEMPPRMARDGSPQEAPRQGHYPPNPPRGTGSYPAPRSPANYSRSSGAYPATQPPRPPVEAPVAESKGASQSDELRQARFTSASSPGGLSNNVYSGSHNAVRSGLSPTEEDELSIPTFLRNNKNQSRKH